MNSSPVRTIVYSGLPYSGKWTNLRQIWEWIPPSLRIAKDVSGVQTKDGVLPLIEVRFKGPDVSDKDLWEHIRFGKVSNSRDFETTFRIRTLHGPLGFFSYRLLLQDFDAIVFILDSCQSVDANMEQLYSFVTQLEKARGIIKPLPWVFQRNKCDFENQELVKMLVERCPDWPGDGLPVEACAIDGAGVWETFLAALEQVNKVKKHKSV